MEKESSNQLAPGRTLLNGKYTITRMIGAGGFGCTYEVTSGGTRYCAKEFFMAQNCVRNPLTGMVSINNTSQIDVVNRSKKKFLEEATVLRMMEHPGIVHVVDIFEENGTAYFVMDYIDGQSLQSLVDKSGPLPEAVAISYMQQVANALDFVHAHHRLHLDIKPDNIMIDPYGRAILIDFGASKYIDNDASTNSSSVFQTPGYAPLEQANGDVTHFSNATDIYGLGATFYKVLSGITPIYATIRADGTPLDPLPDYISAQTRNAVMAALELNRKKRTQSAKEFIDMISQDDDSVIVDDDDVVIVTDDADDLDDSTVVDDVVVDVNGPRFPGRNLPEQNRKKGLNGLQITLIVVAAILFAVFMAMLQLILAY